MYTQMKPWFPQTHGQVKYALAMRGPKPIVIVHGPAGTGKTLAACSYAVQQSKKIVLCRPLVSVDGLGTETDRACPGFSARATTAPGSCGPTWRADSVDGCRRVICFWLPFGNSRILAKLNCPSSLLSAQGWSRISTPLIS